MLNIRVRAFRPPRPLTNIRTMEDTVDLQSFLVAAGGIFCTPFVQGLVLALLLHATVFVSTHGRLRYRGELWLRIASHTAAAYVGCAVIMAIMAYAGYQAGWVWASLLSLYFMMNYSYRSSRGTLPQDAAVLSLADFTGIWLAFGFSS